jgi:hypothetical protein
MDIQCDCVCFHVGLLYTTVEMVQSNMKTFIDDGVIMKRLNEW